MRFERKKSNTEALKPLIIRPKEHASLFKSKDAARCLKMASKPDIEKARKMNIPLLKSKPIQKQEPKLIFSSHEKARNLLGSKSKKSKGKKLEKYLRPVVL
jgi:hypothetical protein